MNLGVRTKRGLVTALVLLTVMVVEATRETSDALDESSKKKTGNNNFRRGPF